MTPKKYLSQLEEYSDKMEIVKDAVIKLRTDIAGVKAVDYSKDRVQSSPSNVQENMIAELIEKEAELDQLFVHYKYMIAKITNEILGLPMSFYSKLLYKRYVEFKRLELIAVEMNYSYDFIRHEHGKALQAFERKYKVSTEKHI